MNEAIKKAIEGGWKKGWRFDHKDVVFVYMEKVDASCKQPICAWMWERVALDPSFWQSLGKAMGWKTRRKCCEGCGSKEKLINGEYHRICSSCNRGNPTLIAEWQYHWHRFIDHLIAGKDADSFFLELLK